jgi:hypothetical protein
VRRPAQQGGSRPSTSARPRSASASPSPEAPC